MHLFFQKKKITGTFLKEDPVYRLDLEDNHRFRGRIDACEDFTDLLDDQLDFKPGNGGILSSTKPRKAETWVASFATRRNTCRAPGFC